MPDIYRIQFLGAPHFEKDGKPLSSTILGSRKALALLSYLTRHPEPASRSHLADLFWPDRPEARGRRNLSRELSQLATYLPGCLDGDYYTVWFKPDPDYWLDIWAFEALVKDTDLEGFEKPKLEFSEPGASGLKDQLLEPDPTRIAEAVTLYRGNFMAGLYLEGCLDFETWLVTEQEFWRQRVLRALEWLFSYYALRHQDDQACKYLERWLSLDPWQENARRYLMILLARNGQRNAALAQFEGYRRLMVEELGSEPSTELVKLYDEIRSGAFVDRSKGKIAEAKQPGLGSTPKPAVTGPIAPPPHNLPATLKSFLGRQIELTRLATYLEDPKIRLVTLAGVGGIGKTELALSAAHSLLAHFADGAWGVLLSGVQAPLSLPGETQESWRERLYQVLATTIATAIDLNLSGSRSAEEQVRTHLHSKRLLLVVDNFEHLIEGSGLLLNLLQAAPGLKLLVTSREHLRLPGEWVLELEGLAYPPPPPQPDWGQTEIPDPDVYWSTPEGLAALVNFEAVTLLMNRARQVIPDFSLTPGNSLTVVKLCRLVEGLPLGLELLAGQLYGFTPDQVLEAVRENLNRLRSDLRHIPERHNSIQAVFEWSWALLAPHWQTLFARLTVFREGFTLEAAQVVAGAEPADLLALLDRSFIRRADSGRYDIHELLRQYGAERLQQQAMLAAETRSRHAYYYAAFLQQSQDHLYPNQEPSVAQAVAQEFNNIRAMWQWAIIPTQLPLLAVLAQAQTGLFHYYLTHGFFQEGLTMFGEAVDRLQAWITELSKGTPSAGEAVSPERIIAQLLVYRSRFAGQRGNYPLALAAGQEALASAPQAQAPEIQVEAHLALADILMKQGDYGAARQTLQMGLPIAQGLTQAFPAIRTCDLLAWTYWYQAKPDEARNYASQALAGYRALNHLPRIAGILNLLGKIYYFRGDYLEALTCLQEALDIYRQLNHQGGEVPVLGNLGTLYRLMGNYEAALDYLNQTLVLAESFGQEELRMYNLEGLSRLYYEMGEGQIAYQYAQDTLARARVLGSPLGEWGGETCLGNALMALGDWTGAEEAHRSAWQRQQSLGGGAMLENLAGLAQIALAQSQFQAALSWVEQILAWLATHDPASVTHLLSIYWICSQVLTANQDPRAAEILSIAHTELQRRATALEKQGLRHAFLERISAHRSLHQAWLNTEA
jgi:predicted ATPase/DNA-binding SARP family transcriptional activator/Tfp pilus assembly protein PilF